MALAVGLLPNHCRLAAVAELDVLDMQVLPDAVVPTFMVSCTLPLFPWPGLLKTMPLPDNFPLDRVCVAVGEICVSQAARFPVKPDMAMLERFSVVQLSRVLVT